MRVLVTGGAGFVGSNLAMGIMRELRPDRMLVLDNLSRRGSALNLPRLRGAGIEFIEGDIRRQADMDALHGVDWVIDCSADPSVLSGYGSSPRAVVETNFDGTLNVLEYVRRCDARLLFLSTSRVYDMLALNRLKLEQAPTRFQLAPEQEELGVSSHGIAETFSTRGPRSFYGMTKLASEMLIEEYIHGYGLKAIINRCGLLAGPWQMGKIDQGVIAFWIFRYLFGGNLAFIGFGGEGRQVRDFLHIDDLLALVIEQMTSPDKFAGQIFNVGGGVDFSCSLKELDDACAALAGQSSKAVASAENRQADIPYYASDCRKLFEVTGWRPQRNLADTVSSIAAWARDHEDALREVVR